MNTENKMETSPILTISAAKRILKYVPRAILIVNTGKIVDAKTFEVLGIMENHIEIVGKKMISFFVRRKITIPVGNGNDNRIQFNFHKSNEKYVLKNYAKIVDRLMQEYFGADWSEVILEKDRSQTDADTANPMEDKFFPARMAV